MALKKGQLTIPEVLKFARHDFLNELQIVLMNIDLGNVSHAKKTILRITEGMNNHAKLGTLRLPKTEEWIITFDWMFTAFLKSLTCNITASILEVDDDKLVACLNRIFLDAEKVLNPISEYEAHFDIQASEYDWSIKISVSGLLPEKGIELKTDENLVVEETNSHNLWTFTIRGR